MAWLPMYLLEKDVEFLNDWLDQKEEIAFLISNGTSNWIAAKNHDMLTDINERNAGTSRRIEYNLWHVSSGPLPLVGPTAPGGILKFKKKACKATKWKTPGLAGQS